MKKINDDDMLVPNIGDYVRSEFTTIKWVTEHQVDASFVTDIRYRVGMNPCIRTTGHRRWYDVSLVKEIIPIRNAPIYRHPNIFRLSDPYTALKCSGNTIVGTIPMLINQALGRMNKRITTTCDYSRAKLLYDKTKVGCKKTFRSIYYVDRRKWQTWVERNYTRFMNTTEHDIRVRQMRDGSIMF